MLNLISISDRCARRVLKAIAEIAHRRRDRPTIPAFMSLCERHGFTSSIARLRELFFDAGEPDAGT